MFWAPPLTSNSRSVPTLGRPLDVAQTLSLRARHSCRANFLARRAPRRVSELIDLSHSLVPQTWASSARLDKLIPQLIGVGSCRACFSLPPGRQPGGSPNSSTQEFGVSQRIRVQDGLSCRSPRAGRFPADGRKRRGHLPPARKLAPPAPRESVGRALDRNVIL